MIAAMEPSATGDAPWYLPVADEVEVFTAAYAARLPVLLKGPTGCGKTGSSSTWRGASVTRAHAATATRRPSSRWRATRT